MPVRPFTPTVALRPGELVQVDTTRLDVMAIGGDGRPVRPDLTIALDVATRSVMAAALREESTRAVDAPLPAEMAVPHPVRPGRPAQLPPAHAAVPYDRLLALDARPEQAAARPVVVPKTIVIDRGAIFISAAFPAACETLGVSVQPAPPRSPAAKGTVERTFGSTNTLFAQHLAGYTRPHVLAHDEAVADQVRFTVAQLQELLDEWIAACRQHRPHDGLHHPLLPNKALAPNETWAALLGASGYVPLPLTGAAYLELLPVRWHPVTGRGSASTSAPTTMPCSTSTAAGPPPPARTVSGRSISTRTTSGRSTSGCPTPTCTRSPGSTTTTSTPRSPRPPNATSAPPWTSARAARHTKPPWPKAADPVLRRARPASPAQPARPQTAPGMDTGRTPPPAADAPPGPSHYADSPDTPETRSQDDARDDVGIDEPGAHLPAVTGALTFHDADKEADL